MKIDVKRPLNIGQHSLISTARLRNPERASSHFQSLSFFLKELKSQREEMKMKICRKLTAELCLFFLTTYRLFELIFNSRSPSSRTNFIAADSNGGCGTQRRVCQRVKGTIISCL